MQAVLLHSNDTIDNDEAYESQFFDAFGQAVLDHLANNATQDNHITMTSLTTLLQMQLADIEQYC